MKKTLGLYFTFAVFGFVLVLSTNAFSQIKTGGYKEIAVEDEGVVAAANFAVEKKSEEQEITITLESIEKAETQTVAGINYRLILNVSSTNADGERTAAVRVTVIVHRNLQGEYSLSSWSSEE